MELRPLTPKQQRDVLNVKSAIESFWDNIKFRKEWEKPLFSKEEVQPLIQEASEIVVRIRSDMDEKDPSFKLRLLDGNAREYLWGLTSNPKKHPERFVRNLVHSVFQDSNGYVEGLTKKDVDEKIKQIQQYLEDGGDKGPLNKRVKQKWEEATKLLNEIVFDKESSFDFSNCGPQLLSIVNSLWTIKNAVQDIELIQETAEETKQEDAQSASDETDTDASGVDVESEPDDKPGVGALRSSTPCNPLIQRVADGVNVIKSEVRDLQSQADEIETDPAVGDKLVSNMNKQCLKLTEELMTHLLKLDELVSSDQDLRTKRKEHVKDIQRLLGDVDNIKGKLNHVQTKIEQERKKAEAEQQAKEKQQEELAKTVPEKAEPVLSEDEIRAKEAAAQLEREQREKEEAARLERELQEKIAAAQKEIEAKLAQENQEKQEKLRLLEEAKRRHEEEEKQKALVLAEEEERNQKLLEEQLVAKGLARAKQMWRGMKFEPKFNVNETSDSFIISTYVPGMREDDIKVSLDERNNTLTIGGYREPTPEELDVMRKKIIMSRKRDLRYFPQHEDEAHQLLRLGAGRYGNFSESYRLRPQQMDLDAITTSYQGGLLKVVIPKRVIPARAVRNPVPSPFGGYGYAPRGRSFFNDDDVWW